MRGCRASLANGSLYMCAAKLVRTASLPFSRTFSGRCLGVEARDLVEQDPDLLGGEQAGEEEVAVAVELLELPG